MRVVEKAVIKTLRRRRRAEDEEQKTKKNEIVEKYSKCWVGNILMEGNKCV